MELFYMIVGVGMMYSWVHSVVIINKRLKSPTGYEKAVLLIGLVGFILIILEVISS
jgi:hypothetical protein